MGAAVVCNIAAISIGLRPRYKTLVDQLRIAIMTHDELPDGYMYYLNNGMMTLVEIAEWITLERACCPFLTFHLDITGNAAIRLTMTGPDVVKEILRHEFHT